MLGASSSEDAPRDDEPETGPTATGDTTATADALTDDAAADEATAARDTADSGSEDIPAEDEQEADARPAWRRTLARIPGELYVLTFLAAITRFVALYNPRSIVFDEVWFREFSLHYKAGTYYFDIHPPLGKLLLGLWAAISGVDATAVDKNPAVAMRILPALAGVALIVVFYFFIRELCGSRRVATLGAGLLLLDNALLAESRLILMDSMLLLFGISAVTLALAARKRTGRAYWWMLGGAAALAGAAASVKLTGVSAIGLVGLIWLYDVISERRAWKPALGQLALLALVPLLLYMSTFAIHFALLPKSGPGDAYMSQTFQSTLRGNAQHSADAHQGFFSKFVELNKVTHRSELSLSSQTHPYASKWTSWPIMQRGVFYYVADAGDQKARYIYLLGNPVVWWGILVGVLVVAFGWATRPARFRKDRLALIFLAVAWTANYLPFVLIHRPMFLYHYFFALLFSLAFVIVGLGALTGWNQDDGGRPFKFASRRSAIGYWALLGVALLSFMYFAPITYGIPLTQDGLQDRMWLSTWR